MSAGLHRLWKDALVARLAPPRRRPFALLDVAGGTGDIAFRVLEAGGPAMTASPSLDINADMLRGRPRPRRRSAFGDRDRRSSRPMPRHCRSPTPRFDAYTIAFGIRNVPRIDARAGRGLSRAEARRALPLPRILARSTCRCSTGSTKPIRSQSSRRSAGSSPATREPYRYLVESIRTVSQAGGLRRDDPGRPGFGRVTDRPHDRRHRGAAFRLEALGRG